MKIRRSVATSSSPPPQGFPRWAWWTLFLATFMFAVPLTSPWWSTILRREVPDAAEDEGEAPKAVGAQVDLPEVAGSTLKVSLYTRRPDRSDLTIEEREIPYARGIVPQINATVSQLAVPSPITPALLPAGTRVLDVAYTKGGTVYIDFSKELDTGREVGAEEEKLLIQGIVTTISENFSAVRNVLILVEGKEPKPEHFDLSRALRRDDPVFAAEPEPSPSPDVSPSAGPEPTSAAPAAPPAAKPLAATQASALAKPGPSSTPK
ncbi:MAG: GerMN domain-containing protein [Vicinamibacteria bacterium]